MEPYTIWDPQTKTLLDLSDRRISKVKGQQGIAFLLSTLFHHQTSYLVGEGDVVPR